jgi:hypothetical protein
VGLPVLLGVEPREVLTDDLGFGVALEALRPRVPACYDAGGIEHVDGVVGHRLDQKPEALFVCAVGGGPKLGCHACTSLRGLTRSKEMPKRVAYIKLRNWIFVPEAVPNNRHRT